MNVAYYVFTISLQIQNCRKVAESALNCNENACNEMIIGCMEILIG